MKIKSILFLLSSAFLVQAGFVQSNQDDPNACYESKYGSKDKDSRTKTQDTHKLIDTGLVFRDS